MFITGWTAMANMIINGDREDATRALFHEGLARTAYRGSHWMIFRGAPNSHCRS
jgi:hypothetical protein